MSITRTSQSFSFTEAQMPVRFGRYLLLHRVGADPIGEDFLAAWGIDEGVDQLRVVRCIYPSLAHEAQFMALFSEEARSLSRLSNANVIQVMEVGREGDIPFVAREHVEGVSLKRLIDLADKRQTPWYWETAAYVIQEVLRGLDYVHRREDIHGRPMRMRHGDLRPGNVLVSFHGEVKITNFGSSLFYIVDERTNAQIQAARGDYTAVRQETPVEASVADDLWGVAAIFWTLLVGRPPISDGGNDWQPWIPPSIAGSERSIPKVFDSLFSRMFNPDPAQRFQSAGTLREALLGVMREHAVGHPIDDLTAWVRELAGRDWAQEEHLVRKMLGQDAQLTLYETTEAGTIGPGTTLDDKYHLLRQLGEGGMGVVFEAEHLGLEQRVAIKVLHDRVLDDEIAVERFRREARITSSLGHPNIVGVLDFGETQECYYLVMDFLSGEPLSQRISRGRLPPGEVCEILIPVCDALEAAHRAGVIHRDLKPENIHLTPDGPQLLDFGIAKQTGFEEDPVALTRTGHVCGTVEYVAPEQIRGAKPDLKGDIYSLGVIMYESLVGETPFRGRTAGETLHKAMNEKLVPPRKRTGDLTLPVELEAICLKALARHPDRRYASAVQLKQALIALALPGTETAIHTVPDKQHSSRRRLAVISGLAVAAGLTVVGLAIHIRSGEKAPPVEDPTSTVHHIKKVDPTTDQRGTEARPGGTPTQATPAESANREEVPAKRQVDADEDPDERAKELLATGFRALKRMKLDQAQHCFKAAGKLNAKLPKVYYGLGKVAFQRGQYPEAVSKVQKAIRLRPGYYRWHVYLAQIYMTMGKRQEAIAICRRVLKAHPDDPAAQELLRAAGQPN